MFGKTVLVTIVTAIALSGCATHKINYTNPQTTPGAVSKHKQSFYLWGLVGGKEVDLAKACPAGVHAINSQSTPVDGILTGLTGGLYSPLTVQVTCAAGGGSAMADEKGAR